MIPQTFERLISTTFDLLSSDDNAQGCTYRVQAYLYLGPGTCIVARTPVLTRTGKPLFGGNNLTKGPKLTVTTFSRVSGGMGDGGAAPMQVEIGENNARDHTGEFIARGENFFSKILPGQNLAKI